MVFDFSTYLINRQIGSRFCANVTIRTARLIDEAMQLYEAAASAIGQPIDTFRMQIGESNIQTPYPAWDWSAVGTCRGYIFTQRSWSDIEIPSSEWNAYKALATEPVYTFPEEVLYDAYFSPETESQLGDQMPIIVDELGDQLLETTQPIIAGPAPVKKPFETEKLGLLFATILLILLMRR